MVDGDDDTADICECVLQPHPASAAAAAVLVAHASSLGPNADAGTKFNADGTFADGPDQAEQGGPMGQGMGLITQGPLVRTQTHKPVCPCSSPLFY